MNILGKQSDLPFSCKSDRKKEKSMVSFMQEPNIICSQTLLDSIAHEQTIICRQLFSGHVVGSRPMKRKKNLLRMIIIIIHRTRTLTQNVNCNMLSVFFFFFIWEWILPTTSNRNYRMMTMLYMCTVGLKWNPDNFFNKVSWNTLPWRTFLKLCWVIMKKRSFSPPTPSKQWYTIALHELPAGNNKHPNFEWRGEGRVAYGFVPLSALIEDSVLVSYMYQTEYAPWELTVQPYFV